MPAVGRSPEVVPRGAVSNHRRPSKQPAPVSLSQRVRDLEQTVRFLMVAAAMHGLVKQEGDKWNVAAPAQTKEPDLP